MIEVLIEVNSSGGLPLGRLLAIEVPACGLRMEAPGYAAGVGPRFIRYTDAPAFAVGHNSRRIPHVGYTQRVGPPTTDRVLLERHRIRDLLHFARAWRYVPRGYTHLAGWADLLRAAGIDVDAAQEQLL